MPTLLEVLRKTTAFFEAKGLETPRLDAEVLIAHGLGLRRLDLYLQHDRPLGEADLEGLRRTVGERGRGVPIAYLVGRREFHSLSFRVTPAVLVPRPETETLVEVGVAALAAALAAASGAGSGAAEGAASGAASGAAEGGAEGAGGAAPPTFADVGTGSGCVAVATLVASPGAHAYATDVSGAALAVAAENARDHGVERRLELRPGDLLEPLRGTPAWGRFAAVLSNPPYVVRGDPSLDASVAAHEPEAALYVPGDDPLAFARRIAQDAREALAPGGLLAIEIGAGSGAAAVALLARLGYRDVALRRDLGGIDRVVLGRSTVPGTRTAFS